MPIKHNIVLYFSIIFTNFLYCDPKIAVDFYRSTLSIVTLESLDLSNCTILKELNVQHLPTVANWQNTKMYQKDRNRIVYLSNDKKCVIKVWQKNYPAIPHFLNALNAKFYDGIAKIDALIFDKQNECCGYITPYLLDRTWNKEAWESYGFVVEKGPIGVKIFSEYDKQPLIYKQFFDVLFQKVKLTNYCILDFCPNNIAIDTHEQKAYLIDLEDVLPLEKFYDEQIINVFYGYNPKDYLEFLKRNYLLLITK